ncbi:PRTRC system ParB family protein [Vreelandella rituensis]|uniref:PRTRC system ParB family protein n=1 Tax=Vreelandella rituensis TaxID=2282306 RepID=A0A368UB33_9GAMM|nr:PRTRC system ParB family protein [Halomonas rituensis]RCV93896.1 PRTRC system ParB family protein [Halomonas rituensis]
MTAQANEQNSLQHLALDKVHRSTRLNPRKHRNAAVFAEILESIRERGVLQPIIVRPSLDHEGMFEVVAGDTRFEASVTLGLDSIPASIQLLNDYDAKLVAATENLKRADLSPIEEAWLAADMMEAHHQNHEEARKQLGWTRSKLDNRLLLSHCCEAVSAALIDGTIKIGHAEIMAPMSEKNQIKVLTRIIEDEMTVEFARQRLKKVHPYIKDACFPTDACQTCRHNSVSNTDLFDAEENAQKAQCFEPACWAEKTKTQLDIIVSDARQEYGVAHLDTEVTANGYKLIVASGDDGVGQAQAMSCPTCEHYGSVISTGFGQEGQPTNGVCFNMACHTDMREAYAKVVNAVSEEAPASAAQDAQATPASPSTGKAGKKSDASKTKPAQLRKGVKRAAFNRFASITEHAITKNPVMGLAISLVELTKAVMSATDTKTSERAKQVIQNLGGDTTLLRSQTNEPELVVSLSRVEGKSLINAMIEISAMMAFQTDSTDQFEASKAGRTNLAILKETQANTAEWDAVDQTYLDAQTKGAILIDARESGFAEAYDEANKKGAFNDLTKKKMPEIKEALLSFTEFDWRGYEPHGFTLGYYGYAPSTETEDAAPTEAAQPESQSDDQGQTEEQQAA